MASATDCGRIRSQNEDSLIADAELGYAVLADGMGGYNAGEVASRIAVATVDSEIRKMGATAMAAADIEQAVAAHVAAANRAIYDAARRNAAYSGMGTTLVMALWRMNDMVTAHVGDSRLYRLRDGVLEQVTRDHSFLQEQIDLGLIDAELARYAPSRNLVTRALGIEPRVDVEVHTHRTQSGDLYLLCSDGLSDMLDERAMTATLTQGPRQLDRLAEALVHQANENGGRDNISVVLARLGAPGEASR
ncbi:MAG: Stp1/IreP family PP2C-type Ser/Thr phosphatase [Rhodospirillaceae bacterium]